MRCLALAGVMGAINAPFPAAAQDADTALSGRLSEAATRRMKTDGVAGVVIALLQGGETVWTGAFGMADPTTGQAMTPDTVFRVESISKPVTAWGTLRLAETGRLDLDAPAADCLHRWQPPDGTPPFTARMLLSHTAGIGLGDFSDRTPPAHPRPGLAEHLADDFDMIAAPGARFAYSDTGYNILELMIEDCTGEGFAAFMTREVLAPLGMAQSGYDWPGAAMPTGHDLHGDPVAPYVYPARGSGGLFATAGDIARFAAAGMSGADQDVLAGAGVAALHAPGVTVDGLFGYAADGYGLGHFTETLSDGRAAVWHGGQGHGWMSHMHIVPESGDGIVILSNSQRAWPLIAAVLRVWSQDLGVAPVGMARVFRAEIAARLAIVLLLVIAAVALRVAARRRLRRPAFRIGAGGLAAGLILWPLWAAAQEYLFLFSILPGLWPWLAGASALAGAGLGAAAVTSARRAG